MFVLNAYFCRELRFVAILRFLLRITGVDSDFTQNFWGKNWRLKSLLTVLLMFHFLTWNRYMRVSDHDLSMISIRFPAFVQQTYLATSLVITLSRFSQKFHVGQTIRSIFAESAYLFILHHVFGEASVSSDGVCNKCDFDCYKCVSSSNVLSAWRSLPSTAPNRAPGS